MWYVVILALGEVILASHSHNLWLTIDEFNSILNTLLHQIRGLDYGYDLSHIACSNQHSESISNPWDRHGSL